MVDYRVDEKERIKSLVKKYSETGIIMSSLLASSEKENNLSLLDIDGFLSHYNLFHEIILKSKDYNQLYDDNEIVKIEDKMVPCFDEMKSKLVKLMYDVTR